MNFFCQKKKKMRKLKRRISSYNGYYNCQKAVILKDAVSLSPWVYKTCNICQKEFEHEDFLIRKQKRTYGFCQEKCYLYWLICRLRM